MSWPQSWFLAIQERYLRSRNRLIAKPAFQRWASGFLLTQPIARANAGALFDVISGFIYTQILLACVRLNLFEILHQREQSVAELAVRIDLTEAATKRLLDAAISLNLISRIGARAADAAGEAGVKYGLGALGAPLVGNSAVLAMIEHHALVYRDIHDPVALLRSREGTDETQLSQYWPYAANEVNADIQQARIAAYTKLMAASQPLVADEVLDAYPLGQHRVLLDIGGGDGTFLSRVAARHAHLSLQLFDLPAVADIARAKFQALGIDSRATAFGGNFLTDAMPDGADVVSFVRIIHDHDDARVRILLSAARQVLLKSGNPEARLLIAEPMADTPGAARMGDAYFGFYLLAMGRGRARTPAELNVLLKSCGFSAPTLLPTRIPMQTSLLVAKIAT
jgi:demethylspheroidene O-methyltransferase